MNTPAYLCLALVLTGCNREPRESPVPKGPIVAVSVDDGTPRRVTMHHNTAIPLASVVAAPMAAWLEVRADTADDRTIELNPKAAGEIRLYVDQDRPAIGVFPAVTLDMSPEIAAIARQPTDSLPGIVTVAVITKRTVLPTLVVEVAGVAHTIAGEALRRLPAIRERHIQGHSLTEVTKLASDRPVVSVTIVGADTFSLDSLDPTRLYVVKLNHRGEYVFRVWDRGSRTPLREVRRVAKIVIP